MPFWRVKKGFQRRRIASRDEYRNFSGDDDDKSRSLLLDGLIATECPPLTGSIIIMVDSSMDRPFDKMKANILVFILVGSQAVVQ